MANVTTAADRNLMRDAADTVEPRNRALAEGLREIAIRLGEGPDLVAVLRAARVVVGAASVGPQRDEAVVALGMIDAALAGVA